MKKLVSSFDKFKMQKIKQSETDKLHGGGFWIDCSLKPECGLERDYVDDDGSITIHCV